MGEACPWIGWSLSSWQPCKTSSFVSRLGRSWGSGTYLCTPFSMCSWTSVLAATSRGSDHSKKLPAVFTAFWRQSKRHIHLRNHAIRRIFSQWFWRANGRNLSPSKSKKTWMEETFLPCSHFQLPVEENFRGCIHDGLTRKENGEVTLVAEKLYS